MRIKHSPKFLLQQKLLKTIIAKHNHDGAGSALIPYLTEQKIDMAVLEAIAAEAKTHDTDRQKYNADKEISRAERDLQFLPVFKNMKAAVQFLKKLNPKNVKALGDWAITTNATGRVKYPGKFSQKLDLFFLFYQKYKELPAADSPLAAFLTQNNIDLDADNTKAEAARESNTAFESFARQAEAETANRNIKWKPIIKNMRGMGQYLIKLNSQNPHAIGDWGFTVDSSPKKAKLQKSKIKLGQTRHIKGVVLGSTLTNLTQTELHLYKGRQKNTPPLIVLPNQAIEITKGFSEMTIVNTSLQQTAIFSVKIIR